MKIKYKKTEIIALIFLTIVLFYWGFTLTKTKDIPLYFHWMVWGSVALILSIFALSIKFQWFKGMENKAPSSDLLLHLGRIRIYKRDIPVFIGLIIAWIGLEKNPILFGTLTIVFGFISKYTKSQYWGILVFLGIVLYILHFLQ